MPDNDDFHNFRARIAADLERHKRSIVGVRAFGRVYIEAVQYKLHLEEVLTVPTNLKFV